MGHEEFLIATSIATAGLFAVLAWNSILLDRRDRFVLGMLPVRTRTIFAAKIAAVSTALAVSVVAVNIFTGLSFPFMVIAPDSGALRSLAAYWITMFAAGLFVFCALLAVHGLAAQLFSYRLFPRVSSFLQLAALFAVLGSYFLTPEPTKANLLAWLPSFWFLGLFQELNGPVDPVFGRLAGRAVSSLAIAGAMGAVLYSLAYYRHVRHAVEQPDIAPGDRSRPLSRLGRFVVSKWISRPLERAVFLFTARTIARSRQHRLLLAVYGGIGFAFALAYTKAIWRARWDHPNVQFLAASLILLFFAIVGVRAAFGLPFALPANWIFRVTSVHSPNAYFTAVRKCLLWLAAAPPLACFAIVLFAIWPGRPVIEHLAICAATAFLLVDLFLYQFRKIPFACSYLPGGANLKVKLGAYGIGFLCLAEVGTLIEFWALERFARFVVLLALLLAAAVWAHRRRSEFAGSGYTPLQFEDLPPADIFALDLRRDSDLVGGEQYIDVRPERGFRTRAKPVVADALILAVCGFAYEEFGQWRDRARFPQIGRSFDIGGRSLNLYCSGEGSPTVILEGNWGSPGYSWTYIQREMAKFTRACWYDRAGYGWSDSGPFPNHGDSIAHDLHKLLAAARIAPPYVLVGHAMGGFHVRVFQGFYPRDVAGLVLADPMNEDMTIHIHNHIEALRPVVILLNRMLGRLGVGRLMAPDPGSPPAGLTAREWATIVALIWQAKSIPAQTKETPIWINGELARASRNMLANLPLIVLSAKIPGEVEDPKLEDMERKFELHAELARLSTQGRLVFVTDSSHRIPLEAPGAIVQATRDLVEELRTRLTYGKIN